MTSEETREMGAAALRAAANDLLVLAAGEGSQLARQLRDASASFERLADTGLGDNTAVEAASTSLAALGEEVQDLCQFPVGSS